MVSLPSSTWSYNRGAPLDNVPREGKTGVGVCHYFQLRLIPLLFAALIQRPAELTLSFPCHVTHHDKRQRVPSIPKPTTFPIRIIDVFRLPTLAHQHVRHHFFGRRHCDLAR
jgi:hypothetical protein